MKKKQLVWLLLTGMVALILLITYYSEDPDVVTIKITPQTKAFTQNVYPPGSDVFALKYCRKGTADDTIIIDGYKIPPGKINYTGQATDFYGDAPFKFSYDPYRAKNASLKIVYDFYR